MAHDPATINKESTNENNTDVDRWADARRAADQWKTMFETMALPQPPGPLCRIPVTLLRWTQYALALDD
jgi:hypothetical protein